MNVNFEKVSEIVIKDANGKVQQRFKLGMASLLKMQDKSQVLELGIAPEERPIEKWGHKNGDVVVGNVRKWGIDSVIKGTVSQMNESKCLITDLDDKNDTAWCLNMNVQEVIKK